jgi:hypothetical protein
MPTYPIVIQAPDGRPITCDDGEHAAAIHILTDPLIWRKVGIFVRGDGDVDWTRLERAPLFASSERLLAQAAMDLYCGPTANSTATLKRLCHVLDTEHLARVLEAVLLLRPDVTQHTHRAANRPTRSGPHPHPQEA